MRTARTFKPQFAAPKRGALSPSLDGNSYRSGLERRIAAQLEQAGVPFTYEKTKVSYVVPSRKAKYTPDYHLNGRIIVEAKGRFRTAQERQKMALVKEQHPDLDIRIVFQRASNPIYKGSPTTYAAWAESHGFPWADGGRIPEAWINEALNA
jgi:hypothetical protein